MAEHPFDGNAEQLRAICDQLAESVLERLDAEDKGRAFHTDHAFIDWLDKRIADKLKLWAATLLLAYCIPLAAGIWQLSAINSQMNQAFVQQRTNTAALVSRGEWMRQQEQYNCQVKNEILQINSDARIGACAFASGDPMR